MKYLKVFLSGLVLYVLLFAGGSQFSACKKTIIEHDTIIKIKTDTVIKKDTVTIFDSSLCNCYNLKDGLVAWYNFNNANLKDSSGNNNHITFNNAIPTTDRFGKANNAYLFDGSSNYMKAANSTSLNPPTSISLMAIVKINGYYAGGCTANQIFGKGWNDYINGFYALRFWSKALCSGPVDTTKEFFADGYGDYTDRTGADDNTSSYIQSNKWYNVIFTADSGLSKIYVNGVLKNTYHGHAVFNPNDQELFIGKHGDPIYPYWFKGVIDELRIYNRALCQGEVNQLNNLKQ